MPTTKVKATEKSGLSALVGSAEWWLMARTGGSSFHKPDCAPIVPEGYGDALAIRPKYVQGWLAERVTGARDSLIRPGHQG